MKYFRLGKLRLSKICLGTWSLGGNKKNNFSYGNMNEKQTHKILDYAYQKGINFYDTANVYGDAEKRLGKFFKYERKKIFIATKVGCTSFNKKLDFSFTTVNTQLKNSIRNLGNNYLDLVQLYNPNPSDKKVHRIFKFLDKMKNYGLIKFIGVSLKSPEDYLKIRKFYNFDTVQCNFNILDHRALNQGIIKTIKSDGAKLFFRTVLNFGIFTNEFLKKKHINFRKDDHRARWDKNQIILWKKYAKRINSKINQPIENISYKFSNSFNPESTIIGATKLRHIDIAMKLLDKKLLKVTKKEIFKNYTQFSKENFTSRKIQMKL